MKHREHEYEEIFKLYIFSFQVSLSRMILDIFKFCCLYLLVLFAFSCGNWLFYHCYQLMMPPIIILMNIWSWNVFLSLMALWPQCPRINIIRKFLAGECTKNVVFQKKPLQDCPKLILPWFNGTVVNNGSDKVEKILQSAFEPFLRTDTCSQYQCCPATSFRGRFCWKLNFFKNPSGLSRNLASSRLIRRLPFHLFTAW